MYILLSSCVRAIMFRIVEDPTGVTHVYSTSTNELVCSVREKSAAPSSAFASSRSRSPVKRVADANNRTILPVDQEQFLALLQLRPSNDGGGPLAVAERPWPSNSGEWPGAQAAVQAYSKYCVSRGRIGTPRSPRCPVVYRPKRHRSYLGHMYSFTKRERWQRLRALRMGLSRRAVALLGKCREVHVSLHRQTPSEVALWTKGRIRLGKTSLRELTSFLLPLRCVLRNVVQQDVPMNAKWSKCVCAAYGRECVCAVYEDRWGTCVFCVPPSSLH
ncbi:hypothetical protein HPB48_021675 [Haemaphysalis longicornis]|uniref:Uncharacterized protein n=1 Tax=Haemaphysalis longicornis TaxID=44386 RepID=A0A9J6FBN5_HAELO|nr:hypothetical protein HPB48_021675 [Haemaphysalis longicornis]